MTKKNLSKKPSFKVSPASWRIGAEIEGIDLSQELSDAVVGEIRQALLKWKVLFFRGQNLDHAAQVAFTARFGEVTYAHPHEANPVDGFPQLFPIDRNRYLRSDGGRRASYDSHWHSDATPLVNPPAASILRAVDVPEFGGDTTWTNLIAAYGGLSASLRVLADGLKAEHRFAARSRNRDSNDPYAQRVAVDPLVARHPVVRVHPETGERALYVSPGFTSHILDVSPSESEKLLEIFFEQLIHPSHTVRFRWRNGDIAFWDNRATAHLAAQDLDHTDVERVLYRTTITGDVPVGVDGYRSQAVQGKPFGSDVPEAIKNIIGKRAETAQIKELRGT